MSRVPDARERSTLTQIAQLRADIQTEHLKLDVKAEEARRRQLQAEVSSSTLWTPRERWLPKLNAKRLENAKTGVHLYVSAQETIFGHPHAPIACYNLRPTTRLAYGHALRCEVLQSAQQKNFRVQ